MPETKDRQTREWTLMFYFASDNPLAPNVVSQLKALKNAGFHQDVNVVAQFDPNVQGVPTHIFDVNKMNKIENAHSRSENSSLPRHRSWSGNDPYVRNLVLDKLWGADNAKIRERVVNVINSAYPELTYELPKPSGAGEPGPKESLGAFLTFCASNYPARHYMLFLLGHGLVVGNDMFLFDANADQHSLSLRGLGEVLSTFSHEAGKVELLSFHSCSLSALEVAYELEDSVNYMLASEGTTFVGSWPYREIVIRVFNDVVREVAHDEADIRAMVKKIFAYVLKTSGDFQLAGYSFDLCLCDLRAVGSLTEPVRALSQLLIDGLNLKKPDSDGKIVDDPCVKDRILLAHWDAQSFWGESYTDLYDFCFCLRRRCEQAESGRQEVKKLFSDIATACTTVITQLENEDEDNSERRDAYRAKLVVSAEFAGPDYQYSHGLSVYFPWSQPDNRKFWELEYPRYKFNDPAKGLWMQFLNAYFERTQRKPFADEQIQAKPGKAVKETNFEQQLLEEISNLPFKLSRPLGGAALGDGDAGLEKPVGSSALGDGDAGLEKPVGSSALGDGDAGLDKPVGSSALGAACGCPSIKNYPPFTSDHTVPKSPNWLTRVCENKERD
ncbi:MAG TPA: clostripain-related cysteine peptidase [Pyrinomonadaceae bacterium]|nr:clostripain-related cysteine peptidase [Pyrinomonadaceae bacterium]